MSFFEQIITTRFNQNQIKDIDRIVKKKKNTYNSRAHFVRSAVLRQIREEK